MALFQFFHATKTREEDRQREKDCVTRIKDAVSQRCGAHEWIDYDESTVAFAGSPDKMELLLVIETQKCDGKKYLYASLDDRVSWQEWEFDNPAEFENSIVEYIANRVERTVKTVIQKEKHKRYRESVYYLDEATGEWVLLEDEQTEDNLVCFIAANKTETVETIQTFKLEP